MSFHYADPTLCWECANAAILGCSWSKNFTPVDGWDAVPTKIKAENSRYIDSYCVISCPEFVRG